MSPLSRRLAHLGFGFTSLAAYAAAAVLYFRGFDSLPIAPILALGIVCASLLQGRLPLMIAGVLSIAGCTFLELGTLRQAWQLQSADFATYPLALISGLAGLSLLLALNPRHHHQSLGDFGNSFFVAPMALGLLDSKGRITEVNDQFCTLFESTREELLGQDFNELSDSALAKLFNDSEARGREKSLELDFRIEQPSGTKVFVNGYGSKLSRFNSRHTRYLIRLTDLSYKVKQKQLLLAHQNRYEKISEFSNDLVLICNARGQITLVNRKLCQLLGLRQRRDLIGKPVTELVREQDQGLLTETLECAARSPGTAQRVEQVRLSSKDKIVIEAQVINLPNVPGIEGTVIIGRPITELLQSLQQTRATEAQFSRIFHASPDAIAIIRAKDRIVIDFNQGFTRLLGFTREEAIGSIMPIRYLWLDHAQRRSLFRQLADAGECHHPQTKMSNSYGNPVDVDLSMKLIEIEGELCVLAIGRDVTEQVKVQNEVRESQEKFSTVFSQSPDGIVILRSRDLHIQEINGAFLKQVGYTRDEVIEKPLLELPVFANSDEFKTAGKLLEESGEHSNVELTLLNKDGQQMPVLISATWLDIDGEPHILCIAKDLSKQLDTENRLRSSEERFRRTFENAPIGILLVDFQGNVFHANHFAAELLGGSQQELAHTHISRLVPAEERPSLKASLGRLTTGSESKTWAERRMICLDGAEIWTHFSVVVQQATSSEPPYLIAQIADITDAKMSQKRMERLAYYDTLTNLANRTLFNERLLEAIATAQAKKQCSALLYLDLDQFKRVNDTLGHETGDLLLQEVAHRLVRCVRKHDTVGRSGGDEFTILLTDISSPLEAASAAEKVVEQLRDPINVAGQNLIVTTSVGITMIPADGNDATALMKNADLAMYQAKERGRNNYQFYSEEMSGNASERLRLEYDLRRALEENEFELYYQPKVRLSDQRIVGVECLVRWNHPNRGLLGPNEFIEVAEETGAIVDLGAWVIEAACRAARGLSSANKLPIYTAINISPRQFRDPKLVQTIQRSLRESSLNPNFLELEITETMLMEDIAAAQETLNRLADLGVRLAIDDFGTGYSSLNYLKKFPIHTVKVDRSFVTDIPSSQDDMEITAAVIAMAHRLNMEVVAEGVETRDQLLFLQRNKCEYGQGYLFARPLPYDEMIKMLAPNVSLLRNQHAS